MPVAAASQAAPDGRREADAAGRALGDGPDACAGGRRPYYLVCFLDEYSRYIVHHEVLTSMDGHSISLAAQAAIDRLPRGVDGRPAVKPVIQSDNGSGYVCREFATVLTENGLGHHRITPHCPEENGVMERAYRTLRESLDGEELIHPFQGRGYTGADRDLVQHRTAAQRLGLPATGRLLPRRSRDPARGTPPQTGRGPTPTARKRI